jgi:hypothetical protein
MMRRAMSLPSADVAGSHPHRRQVVEPDVDVAPRPLPCGAGVLTLGAVGPVDAHRDRDVRAAPVVDVAPVVPARPHVGCMLDRVTVHPPSVERLFETVSGGPRVCADPAIESADNPAPVAIGERRWGASWS